MERRDYSGAIRWLHERNISPAVIARLFDKAESSIPVIAWRDKNLLFPRKVERVLSDVASTGLAADQLLKQKRVDRDDLEVPYRMPDIENDIDQFGRHFWEKVRYQQGAKELGLLLRKVSKPSWENIPLRRAAARLNHLLSEIYLHAGCCLSSLVFGLKAYQSEEDLYKETLSREELFRIGKTCLLISQALINRSQFGEALAWINRSKQAFEAGHHDIDPEHYKQLATVQFHGKASSEAKSNYIRAGELLRDYRYRPNVSEAEVRDISERHLHVIGELTQWESAFTLMEYALRNWPGDDIHKALNVNWAAAAGLMSDSTEGNRRAMELLRDQGHLSNGFFHPQTVTELLEITPNLPRKLQPEWVRFSLHYNAFRNK